MYPVDEAAMGDEQQFVEFDGLELLGVRFEVLAWEDSSFFETLCLFRGGTGYEGGICGDGGNGVDEKDGGEGDDDR